MNFETPPIESPQEKKALDDKWYDRFKEVASFADYEYLTGNKSYREKQKDDFLRGEIENPSLDYPALENFDFEGRESELLALKKDILDSEKDEVVAQLYRWRINEKIAELRMLKSSQLGNDKKVARYSKFIYGQPEKEIYNYTISQVKKDLDKNLFSIDPQVKNAAEYLNKELFDPLMEADTEIDPKKINLPSATPEKEASEYSAEDIRQAFERALGKYKLTGWDVIIDKEGSCTAITVSQENKKVIIPEDRKLKLNKLAALIEHEIGTHVARRENGERSKLKILGLGLDRYLKGEEGIATYQEQKVLGAKEFAGLDGHLAISLAVGMDNKKRNFRQVFEILKNYYLLTSKKTGSEALVSAQNSAWARCVRTFRGTTCQTPGACLTRDIVYREGNIGVWNVVNNNPKETRRFSVGKYDPNNPRHIWILDQLNIIDEDLEELENIQ